MSNVFTTIPAVPRRRAGRCERCRLWCGYERELGFGGFACVEGAKDGERRIGSAVHQRIGPQQGAPHLAPAVAGTQDDGQNHHCNIAEKPLHTAKIMNITDFRPKCRYLLNNRIPHVSPAVTLSSSGRAGRGGGRV